jgi:hypothetical protein
MPGLVCERSSQIEIDPRAWPWTVLVTFPGLYGLDGSRLNATPPLFITTRMPFIDTKQDQSNKEKIATEHTQQLTHDIKILKTVAGEQRLPSGPSKCEYVSTSDGTINRLKGSELRESSQASDATTSSVFSRRGRSDSIETATSSDSSRLQSCSQNECCENETSAFLAERGIHLETIEEFSARMLASQRKERKEGEDPECKSRPKKKRRIGMGRPPMSPKSKKKAADLLKKRNHHEKELDFTRGPHKNLYARYLDILEDGE